MPCISQLRKLSNANNVETGQLDFEYLKQRTASLTNQEKIVTLLIDEVYTAQRIEYNNGAFIGLTEDGLPAKTVLAFMVQSVCCKFKDVVCLLPILPVLLPINRLDTALLRKWFHKVMLGLHSLFIVATVSVDNHVCNRYV